MKITVSSDLIRDKSITPKEFRILCFLALQSETHIQLEKLSEQIGVCYKTTRLALDHLADCGLVQREKRGTPKVYCYMLSDEIKKYFS